MGALSVRRLERLAPEERRRLLERATAAIFDPTLVAGVRDLVEDVLANGDEAIVRALARYDGVDCPVDGLRVTVAEFEAARAAVPPHLLAAIRQGIGRIRAFNERVLEGASWQAELEPGLVVGERSGPIDSAGLFVPSGKGSFPSVLMQIGTPAAVAGVPRIARCAA